MSVNFQTNNYYTNIGTSKRQTVSFGNRANSAFDKFYKINMGVSAVSFTSLLGLAWINKKKKEKDPNAKPPLPTPLVATVGGITLASLVTHCVMYYVDLARRLK